MVWNELGFQNLINILSSNLEKSFIRQYLLGSKWACPKSTKTHWDDGANYYVNTCNTSQKVPQNNHSRSTKKS